MKVTKEDSDTREVIVTVDMEPEDVEPFLERAYRRMVNRVQISGFRRGKAPRAIVESVVGKSGLIEEAVEFMVPETLERVLEEEHLQAFGQPDVELVSMEPPSFKAVVALEPTVDLGDFRSLRLESESVEVKEEEVSEALEHIRYDSTPWEPADRPAQFGDLLTLDVKGVVGELQVANDKGIDYVPGKDNLLPLPGFSVYLEGMKKGESKEFALPVPQDHPDATVAGQECHFNVTLHEIKGKNLPLLDDEFAKGVGEGYDSLEELRNNISERLLAQAERLAQRQFQEKSLAEVVKGAQVEVAPRIIEREVEHLLEERAREASGRNMSMEAYLQNVGKSAEELKEDMRPAVVERLTEDLIIRKLVEEEGIEVSSEEVEAEIGGMVSDSGSSGGDSVQRALSSEGFKRAMRSAVIRRKALERLAVIVSGTDEVEAESSEGEVDSVEAGEGGGPSDD